MSVVAIRYARAFAEVVTDRKIAPDQAVEELNTIAHLVKTSSELRNVLQNPSVAQQQKLNLLDAIVKKTGGSKSLRNFIAVLIDQHRIGQIEEIAQQFRKELDDRLGIADARVSSARELSSAERKSLEEQMASITGKEIRASYQEDESLLGGAVVRIGSTIYDGSVRGRLRKMKERIAGS
jgi:F-type H+-transporting ATPase subunit delta